MNIRIILLTVVVAVCFSAVAAPSPWDSWRSGYTSFEQGEALRERGRYTEAVEMFENARKSYLAVRAARPDWNQRVIADRLRECEKQLNELRRLLGGGSAVKTEKKSQPDDVQNTEDVTSSQTENISRSAEIKQLQRELYQLKAELQHTRELLQKQRNFETEITALLRDRKIAEEKLALLEKRYQTLQQERNASGSEATEAGQRLVQEKVESERLRKRLAALEQQLTELQENLKEAQLGRRAAEKRIAATEAELKRKDAELARILEKNAMNPAEKGGNNSSKVGDSAATDKKFENLAAAYNDAKKMLAQREQELGQLKAELQQQLSEGKVNAAEIANLRKRNKELEDDVKHLSQKVNELSRRLERRNSEDFQAAAAAKQTREKLENDLLNLQKELISLRGNLDAKNAEIANAERRVKSLEAELLALRATALENAENVKRLRAENAELQKLKTEYAELQRNFNALAAENRENKILADAAKPREAELERAKLMLLEMDRLKRELAREQRLNAELKAAYNRDQAELRALRSRSAELDAARRKLVELEAIAKEVPRLRKLESELSRIKGREAELAQVKIRLGELTSQLREREVMIADYERQLNEQKKQLGQLKALNEEIVRLRRNNDEFRAMIANQNSELDRLNTALKKSGKTAGAGADPVQLAKYRELAAQLGPLNDRLQKLQEEAAKREQTLNARLTMLNKQLKLYERDLEFKEKELSELKKLNADLADYRKNSAATLLERVDESKLARLNGEIEALNRLNAEIAAERDRLQAELDKIRNNNDSDDVETTVAVIAPEQAASNGMLAEKEGKFELAIWNYKQALAGDNTLTAVHLRLGVLLVKRGSFSAAVPHLSQALAVYPDNIGIALALTECHLELKRYGNAQGIIEPLLLKHGNNARVLKYAALVDIGTGNMVRAEERLQTALRLEPENGEIYLELSKLLTTSVSDRRSEAAFAYEKARRLGCDPDPYLEKELGSLLDHRRELVRFLSGAAGEAELSKDWNSAVWYYKKIVAEKHPEYVPYLALAQWKAGNASGAKETLEFHKPSRLGMVVLTMIALDEKDETAALRFARQSTGAKIPPEWVGMNMELERLKTEWFNTTAGKMLLRGITR